MSFFDDASLAFLPSGGAGKDGKAYSIKPTDGTGDFTFSRGSNLTATRVGPTGLIEKGRENLLLQSNQFDTTWTLNGTATSGASGYDGSTDAWAIDKPSGSSLLLSVNTTTTSVCTLSIYVKINPNNGILLATDLATGYASFNISDSNQTTPTELQGIDVKQEYVGNNFYRLSITSNGASYVRFYNRIADGTAFDSATSTHIIQDAQLELGLAATDYIESGASTGKAGLLENEPRFDYSGGATCPSLLLEPSRTNLVRLSEAVTPGLYGWTLGSGTTLTLNDAISPEGVKNAFRLDIPTAINTTLVRCNVLESTQYTFSFYVKRGTATELKYSIFNFSNLGNIVATTSYFSQTNTSDFVRIVVPFTTPIGCTDVGCYLDRDSGANGSAWFYGLQLEAGSYPTSYIPNHSGGSATRTADDATLSNINTNIVDITGDFTFFVDNTGSLMKGDELYYYFIELYWDAVTAVRYYSTNNGGWYFKPDNSYTGFSNSVGRQIIKYENGVFYHFLNGSKSTDTRTMATTNSLSRIKFLTNTQGKAGYLDVKQALLFNTALSDADCIALTS